MIDKQAVLNQEYANARDQGRPFIMLRPRMLLDGNQWCALYGDNVQDGVAGFGESPELAAWDFDKQWVKRKEADAHSMWIHETWGSK